MSAFYTARAAGILIGIGLAWTFPAAGQQKLPASAPEAIEAYRDAANFQNNGAFDLALDEWQKFLRNFPKDPLAAKAEHYLGVCQLQLKQPEAAIAAFERVIQSHPQFELLEDVYLNLGAAQYSLALTVKPELYPAAEKTFAELVAKFPKGKHAEEALYYLGESLYAQGKKEAAAKAYERLLSEFAETKRRAEALYALGVAQEELSQPAKAVQTYELFIKDFRKHELAGEVRMRMAESLLSGGDAAGAARLFAELAATKDFKMADHALSRQAYCMAKQDKYAEAGSLYARVVTEFQNSTYAPEASMSAGRCYYRANVLPEAKHWFASAVTRKDENSVEAAHWLCRILLKLKDPAAAADVAKFQLERQAEGPFGAPLQVDLADALYENAEKKSEAQTLYEKFATENPQHELAPQARYNAAFAALELKQYDAAVHNANAFLTAYPQDKLTADVKHVAAESQLQLKNYGEAESLFRQLVEQHADHADTETWRVRQGLVAYLQKKYDDATRVLSPLAGKLKSADSNAEAHFLIGASQFHSERFPEAAKALTASLAANSKWRQSDEALLLLGRTQARLQHSAEAKQSFQALLASFPQSLLLDQAHYRLGELAYQANDYSSAIADYDVVATKWPASAFAPYALYGKAWSQLKSQQHAGAVETFTALVAKFPQHTLVAETLFGRALSRRQAGDAKGAIEDLDAYLKTNPEEGKRTEALHEKGLTLVAARDFAAATQVLEELLKSSPLYASADKVLYEIGWALKSQNQHSQAATQFAKIVTAHPASPLAAEAAFHVGEEQYEKKQYADAAKSYQQAKDKASAADLKEKAAYKLGWANYQLKDYSEALAEFSAQGREFPQGPLAADAAFMKAECLFRQENYKDALPAYEAALAATASSPTIESLKLLHAGQSAGQVGQWEQSITFLNRLCAEQPQSPLIAEAHYELGWAKQNLNQTNAALADYEAAATKSRDHVGARARFMIGELHFAGKKHVEAIREFQRSMFGYGADQATSETKQWQARSGYEAGRCAEVLIAAAADPAARQKHLSDARRFYTFVAERHASHELAAEAKKRLSALSKL